MTSFELVDSPLPDPAPGDPATYSDSCDCELVGSRLPVLLSIEDGAISIAHAACRRSFVFLDDLEAVSSDEIPMTLTYHDTTHHYPEVEYDGYWHLTIPVTPEVTP
jgi:hypothetical protein